MADAIEGQSDDLIRQLRAELAASAEAQNKLAKVQAEANEIERAKVQELAKLRLAEERRSRNLEEIVSRYAKAGEVLVGLEELSRLAPRLNRALDYLEQQAGLDAALEELSDHIGNELDEIGRVLLLLLDRNGGSVKQSEIDRATARLDRQQEITSLRKQLKQQRSNLRKRKELEATYGSAPPLSLQNEIEVIENAIAVLESRLESLYNAT